YDAAHGHALGEKALGAYGCRVRRGETDGDEQGSREAEQHRQPLQRPRRLPEGKLGGPGIRPRHPHDDGERGKREEPAIRAVTDGGHDGVAQPRPRYSYVQGQEGRSGEKEARHLLFASTAGPPERSGARGRTGLPADRGSRLEVERAVVEIVTHPGRTR